MNRPLERVVAELSDGLGEWNWRVMDNRRDFAAAVLRLMNRHGLIEHRPHPSGGDIWRVNGKLYGRTDGITHKKFDAIEDSRF